MEFRLPRGSDPGPDQMPKDIPVVKGAVGAEADTRDPGQTRQLRPLSRAKPKRPKFELPIRKTPAPRRPLPVVGTQLVKLVTDRFAFEMPTVTYLGLGRQLQGAGTQPVADRFTYELPPRIRTPLVLDRLGDDLSDMPNSMHDKLLPRVEVYDSIRSPEAGLMDTVAHLQLEVEALKFVQSKPSTLAMKTLPVQSNQCWSLRPRNRWTVLCQPVLPVLMVEPTMRHLCFGRRCWPIWTYVIQWSEDLRSTFLSSADGIVDLAGDVTVGVLSPADLCWGRHHRCVGPRSTLLEVSPSEWHPRPLLRWRPRPTLLGMSPSVCCSRPDLAGGVTVGVAPSADAEVVSSVVIPEAASSADLAGDVTVGVASSAVAGVASPADIAEVASLADLAEVASSADLAGYVTVGVTSSADTVNVVTTSVAFQEKCDVPSGLVCDYDDYFNDGHYDENPDYFDCDGPGDF